MADAFEVDGAEENLGHVGVRIRYGEIWEGTPPDRTSRPDLGTIRSLHLPFTPKAWWDLTTRDGRDYIGGCCGTASAMQDIVCAAYRDGGWIDADDLLELGGLGESHQDGFENWGKPLRGPKLVRKLTQWRKLSRWSKIGVIYRVTKAKLKPPSARAAATHHTESDEKTAIWVARNGLQFLSWRDLFERNKEREEQDHANRLLLIARVLPAMKLVMGSFEGYPPFEGVAIVSSAYPDQVLDNHHGACIFKTLEEARPVIEQTTKSLDGAVTLLLRPVRVTVQEGVKFLDGGKP